MKPTQNKILLVTGILLLLVLFGWNSVLELRAEEPRRAIVSLEMLLRGEFLVPHINNWSYYNKPPVFNWWMLSFFKLFGSFEEWVVRMPSLIAYLATAALNFYIVKRFLNKEIALFSSLFFLTAADIFFYGTVNSGEIDLFFSLLVFGQVMAIFVFFEKKQFLWMFLVSYALAALGTLTKGPPSIAFQALTLLPWLLLNRSWRLLFHWKHFLGIAAYMLLVGGYFYAYSLQDDVLGFMVRLFKESSQRTGMEHGLLDTIKQSAIFPLFLAQLLLPWSLFAFFFFRKDFVKTIKANPILRFSVIFILFNIPLYWLTADHKARYLYMFFPFFCLLLAYFFKNAPASLQKGKTRIEQLFFGLMVLITLAFCAPPFIPQTTEIPLIFVKCLLLVSGGIALLFIYRKFPKLKLNVFILIIVLVRLGFNFTYLPATAKYSSAMIYRAHIQQVLSITGEQPIHWTGTPYTFESDASIGPLTFEKTTLTSAPLLPYQIPYYVTKGNHHIMQFDTLLKPDHYYMAHQSFLKNKPLTILYRFPDKWLDDEVILFKTE